MVVERHRHKRIDKGEDGGRRGTWGDKCKFISNSVIFGIHGLG
jgi:hypothetical protein